MNPDSNCKKYLFISLSTTIIFSCLPMIAFAQEPAQTKQAPEEQAVKNQAVQEQAAEKETTSEQSAQNQITAEQGVEDKSGAISGEETERLRKANMTPEELFNQPISLDLRNIDILEALKFLSTKGKRNIVASKKLYEIC